jgi:hypothetical protein
MAQDATSIVHMSPGNMVKGGPIVTSHARAGKGEGNPEGQTRAFAWALEARRWDSTPRLLEHKAWILQSASPDYLSGKQETIGWRSVPAGARDCQLRSWFYFATQPQSTRRSVPVMNEAFSLARK